MTRNLMCLKEPRERERKLTGKENINSTINGNAQRVGLRGSNWGRLRNRSLKESS